MKPRVAIPLTLGLLTALTAWVWVCMRYPEEVALSLLGLWIAGIAIYSVVALVQPISGVKRRRRP